MFDVPNIIGLIALTMTVVALTRRSNHGLLAVLGLSVLLWAVHYGLLGSVSGFMVHLVAAISLFVAHWMQNAGAASRGFTGAAFSIAGVSCCWYFGTGWADVLAAVGCVIITMTQFLGRGNTLRVGFMTGETVFRSGYRQRPRHGCHVRQLHCGSDRPDSTSSRPSGGVGHGLSVRSPGPDGPFCVH